MFFTKAATARILKVATSAVREVRVWANVVWVNVKGVGSRFVSKKAYYAEFARYRREGSRELHAEAALDSGRSDLDAAWVVSGGKEVHRVELAGREFGCDCYDFQGQMELMGKGCCKHVYAALRTLGYGSMAEFIRPELRAA